MNLNTLAGKPFTAAVFYTERRVLIQDDIRGLSSGSGYQPMELKEQKNKSLEIIPFMDLE